MRDVLAYLTVFLAAATPWLEVLLVVPAGIVAGLPPIPTVLVAFLGNTATLVPLVLGADRVRGWWRRRRDARAATSRTAARAGDDGADVPADPATPVATGRGARARRLFDRFGLPGLALLGPLLTGIHVAAIVALAAGAERRPTVLWSTGGIAVWAVVAGLATVVGIDTLVDPDSLPDLGLR